MSRGGEHGLLVIFWLNPLPWIFCFALCPPDLCAQHRTLNECSSSPAFSYVRLKTWPLDFYLQCNKKAQTCYSHFLVTLSSSCYSPVSLLSLKKVVFFTDELLVIAPQVTVDNFFLLKHSFSLGFPDPIVLRPTYPSYFRNPLFLSLACRC